MGCDWALPRAFFLFGKFQSTHPHGVRRLFCNLCLAFHVFQSTHPHGVRRPLILIVFTLASFNPRTHMGCDAIDVPDIPDPEEVSIHAPTWGATPQKTFKSFFLGVSIHAPTWGATRSFAFPSYLQKGFNPRTHMGCDSHYNFANRLSKGFNPRTHMGCDILLFTNSDRLAVSIHAPTWGATHYTSITNIENYMFQSTHPHGVRRCSTCRLAYLWCFNPRTHMGCDKYIVLTTLEFRTFQSTHPHGVRLKQITILCSCSVFQSTHPHGVRRHRRTRHSRPRGGFNPRTHMGCDKDAWVSIVHLIVSIHAPTWGATGRGAKPRQATEVSIHAPTWGATQNVDKTYGMLNVSIHAPTWGATVTISSAIFIFIRFQSTHPHGVRRRLRVSPSASRSFNPRTHMGCDLSYRLSRCDS